MTFPIYAFGYTGRSLDTIGEGLVNQDGILLDIRYSPRSRAPMWNRKNLEERLGDRYIWAGDTLGNRLYRTDAIEIADLALGLELIKRIAEHQPVALMCVCKALAGCHREVICEALEGRGFTVLHHPPASFRQGELGAGAPESNRDASTLEGSRSASELHPHVNLE